MSVVRDGSALSNKARFALMGLDCIHVNFVSKGMVICSCVMCIWSQYISVTTMYHMILVSEVHAEVRPSRRHMHAGRDHHL